MKKSIVFLLLLAGTTSFAQHFELGAKAGANFSNFTGASNAADLKAKTLVGFHVGGFVSLFVGNSFAIQPEVLLSTQGAKIENGTDKRDLTLTYINVPVMLKFRSAGGFYLEAGPQIGFKIHEKKYGTSEDFAKSTDFSIAGGLGYHSSIGLGIGARYTAGISKLGDLDVSNPSTPDWKNGVIQVSLFYTLFNNNRK
ncbi:MAG TPA: porin family protein [Chitinophagaceae bacterium]|nr:porin family protein [Chitinophagaceae bacterium]